MSGNQDNGGRPRYVPPPLRNVPTGYMMEEEGRPQSARSDSSFVSQFDTSLSIDDLSGSGSRGGSSGNGRNGDIPIMVGASGYQGDYGQRAMVGPGGPMYGGNYVAMNAGGYQRGYGANSGPIGASTGPSVGYGQYGGQGGYGRNMYGGGPANQRDYNGGQGGYGRNMYGGGPASQRDYTFGSMRVPSNQPQNFLRQDTTPTHKNTYGGNYGPIGSGTSSANSQRMAFSSASSGSDTAVNTGTTTDSVADDLDYIDRATKPQLVHMIKNAEMGHGEDLAFDDMLERQRSSGPRVPSLPTYHTSMATTSHHGPKHSIADAKLDPNHKGNTLIVLRDGNTKGNAVAFLAVDRQPLPEFFSKLHTGYLPTVDEFFFTMPVSEPCRIAVANNAGVIRIRNIPYDTPKAEVTAFVGRNAQILSQPEGTPYFGTHIIMERHTAKTMDAFIEFVKPAEAEYVIRQIEKRRMAGRPPRVGTREVSVELSSQEDLMAELFPRAKNVVWEGATPRIIENNESFFPNVQAAGFTGFLQGEEMVMIVKHAEVPHRSPQARRHLVRVYECQISTLHKYPWFAHDCVFLSERRLIYDATVSLAKALIKDLRKEGRTVESGSPTPATLQELTVAALTCPGFSESQKAALVSVLYQGGFAQFATSAGMNLTFGGTRAIAADWPFQVAAIDPGAHDTLVEFFRSTIYDATMGGKPMTLAEKHALRSSGGMAQGRFGRLTINYGDAKTIADVGKVELACIEELLRRVLPQD